MSRHYTYKFPGLKRSCGHLEDAIETSLYAHEPTVRQWESEKLCRACGSVKAQGRARTELHLMAQARRWMEAHGIDGQRPSYTVFHEGEAIEVTLVLTADELTEAEREKEPT